MGLTVTSTELMLRSGGRTILRYADVTFRLGARTWIAGPSGSGKTLFARALTGILPPGVTPQGKITLLSKLGDNVPSGHPRAIYVPQSPASALPSAIGCGQLLDRVAAWSTNGQGEVGGPTALESLGLDPAQLRPLQPHQLSGGMALRYAIALGLAARPDLLILDEPTIGLDPESAGSVVSTICSAALRDVPVIIVSHDPVIGRFSSMHVTLARQGQLVRFLVGEQSGSIS